MSLSLVGNLLKFANADVSKVKIVKWNATSPTNTNTNIFNIWVQIPGQANVYNDWKVIQLEASEAGFPDNPNPKIWVDSGLITLEELEVSHGFRNVPGGPEISLGIKFNMTTESGQYNDFFGEMEALLNTFTATTSSNSFQETTTYIR